MLRQPNALGFQGHASFLHCAPMTSRHWNFHTPKQENGQLVEREYSLVDFAPEAMRDL